jgi:hypothetical protein
MSCRARDPRRRSEPRRIEQQQGGDERHIADGVAQDRPPGTERGDHQAGQRRSDDARRVEGGGVQADRVGHVPGPDQLRDEGLPGGIVERRADAEDERKQVDVPGGSPAADRQQAECRGRQGHPELSDLEDPALVEPVGHQAAVRRQQQHR